MEQFYEILYMLKRNEGLQALAMASSLADKMGDYSIRQKGFLWFIAGEIGREYGDTSLVMDDRIIRSIKKVVGEFEVIVDKSQELYEIGALYGGLTSVNYFLNDSDISYVIKGLKNYAYTNFTKEGILCSRRNDKAVTPELLLACVPFGLFEPEDLVLVEAVKVIRLRDMSLYERLLYSDYLLEKGAYHEFTMAIEKVQKKNKSVQEEKFFQWLLLKAREKDIGDYGKITHEPYGNNNRYNRKPYERVPNIIKENTVVEINGTVFANEDFEMKLVYWETGGKPEEVTMTKMTDCYRASIHSGVAGRHISYYIDNGFDRTKIYTFYVNRTLMVQGIESYSMDNRSNKVCFFVGDKGEKIELNLAFYEKSRYYIGFDYKEGDALVTVDESLDGLRYLWEYNQLLWNKKNGSFIFIQGEHEVIRSEKGYLEMVIDDEGRIIETTMCFLNDEEGKVYGLGERYNSLDHKGQRIDAYVYNQYKDQGIETYLPIPLMLTTSGIGTLIDTTYYNVYETTEEKNSYQLTWEGEKGGVYFFGGSLKAQLAAYYKITGMPQMIPKWGLGPWMSSNNWDSQEEVMKQFDKTLALEIPATVMVIEAWSDEATYYIFNDAKIKKNDQEIRLKYDDFEFPQWGRWPDPRGMVERLHENGTKCILWQIPVIKKMTSLKHHQRDRDEAYAINHGLVVKNSANQPYRIPEDWFIHSLVIDFSNPKGKQWWFDKRQYLVDGIGIDGFKTDGGECVFGKDLQFYNGHNGNEMRNQYPNDYIKAYNEFITNQKEGMTFSRAGYTGAHTMAAHWAGDERSTFEAFRRHLIGGLNAALSGIVFWGWDLAGFSGEIPTADLYLRSTQMSAFCPIMQYHAESKAQYNQDRTPWNIAKRRGNNSVIDIYRYYANLRMNMIPYLYMESLYCCREGEPLMKPLVMVFEEDSQCQCIEDQYMLGRSLLVAPIMEADSTQREVYLPKGTWTHFFTGEVYEGGASYGVNSDYWQLPVFIREGMLIPLNLPESMVLGEAMSNNVDGDEHLMLLSGANPSKSHFNDGNTTTFDVEFDNREVKVAYGQYQLPIRLGSHKKQAWTVAGRTLDEKQYGSIFITEEILL